VVQYITEQNASTMQLMLEILFNIIITPQHDEVDAGRPIFFIFHTPFAQHTKYNLLAAGRKKEKEQYSSLK
jgi:hypothetical protein